MTSLIGELALVTGGAVRVGAAISRALARAGARVAVHHHAHAGEAEALAAELSGPDTAVRAFHANLRATGAERTLFDAVEAELGQVTMLVNNAGLIATTPLAQFDSDQAETLYALNALAPMRMMAEMARRKRRGVIINIVDSSVERAWARHTAYVASKAALLAASRAAAVELAPDLRVNVVNPGTVALRPEEEPRVAQLEARIPLGHIGSPEDIGAAVVFLAGAKWATGAVLDVDGGSRLH